MSVEFQRLMELEPVPPQLPPSAHTSAPHPTAGDEQLIWEKLVPRLVHPMKLDIIKALIASGKAASATELCATLKLGETSRDLVAYHVNCMAKAGVLEGAERSEGDESAESRFFFPVSA
jgi:Helix-turn-helix domain